MPPAEEERFHKLMCAPVRTLLVIINAFVPHFGSGGFLLWAVVHKFIGGEIIMPSNAILQQKQEYVAELAEAIRGSVAGVIVSYAGITVADDTKLRKELREAGVDYRVVKNTLLKRAANECGLEGLDSVLEGSTAIAMSGDHTAAARILCKYAENSKTGFTVKSGYMDGAVISVDEVQTLAKLPSREVLLGTIAGTLNNIIASFARAVQAVADAKAAGADAPAAPAEEAPAAE